MIGERIEAPAVTPVASIVCTLVTACLVVIGLFVQSGALLWMASLPAAVAVAGVAERRGRLALTFTPTGIVLDDRADEFLYSDVWALRRVPDGVPRSKKPPRPVRTIEVYHERGCITLRGPLSRSLGEIYAFLLQRLGLSGSREINPALAPHLGSQIETFGADRVYSFRTRYRSASAWRRKWSGARGRALRIGLASVVAGVVWVSAGAGKGRDLLVVPGALLIAGGLIALLSTLATYGVPFKRARDAALVISPLGLALKLGDMIGELKWEELRAVKSGVEQRDLGGNSPAQGAIRLEVEGTAIGIPDCFDRPVEVIYRLIFYYWRGTPLTDSPDLATP